MKKRAASKSEKKVTRKRPSSALKPEPRRNIKKVLHEAELSHSVRGGLKDNIFLSNCDTWSNVHCHRPKSGKKNIIVNNIEQKSGRSINNGRRESSKVKKRKRSPSKSEKKFGNSSSFKKTNNFGNESLKRANESASVLDFNPD